MASKPDDQAACFVCRCEEIGEGEVSLAMAEGALTVDDVKRRTKAGMGLCQGIYCAPTIAAMIAAVTGQPAGSVPLMTARAPVRPIPLESLAALGRAGEFGDDGETERA